jgi:NAD(P)-dependent dehydrogenase (short-subunit alcohol dehydrogenase family)
MVVENVDIVIVGSSGGLGKYLFSQLSRDFEVWGTYRKSNPEMFPGDKWLYCDVTDIGRICDVAESFSGSRNLVVVNLAGVSIDGMGHKTSDMDWDKVIETNLYGTFNCCRAFLPVMRKNGWGRIINISSVVAQVGVPGTVAYSASKSALFGLTRTLAAENATRGITVNCLALGYFDRGMIDVLSPEMREKVVQTIPMKKLGDPSNIEAAIRFLIAADYVTGQVININGGLV